MAVERKNKAKAGSASVVRKAAGFLFRSLNVILAGGVILSLFAQAWGLALVLWAPSMMKDTTR